MRNELKFNHPWLVAVWRGMANVAISTGCDLFASVAAWTLSLFAVWIADDQQQFIMADDVASHACERANLSHIRAMAPTSPNPKTSAIPPEQSGPVVILW